MKATTVSKIVASAVSGLCLASVSGAALAQQGAPAQGLLDNAWVFNLGAFVYGSDLNAALNGRSTTNPEIDFDEDFGIGKDATRVRGDLLWRITPAHHLRLSYFDNKTERSRVFDRDIKWGDYTFKANGRIDLSHKHKVTELAYEWAFTRSPTYEVSAILGVHYSETDLSLTGDATITNADGTVSNVSKGTRSSTVPAPLPVLGLRGGWLVAPSWYIDAGAQFFGVNYEGYDGTWSDLRVSVTWMFNKNWGLGLGYNRFSSKLDVSKDDFKGTLDTGYSGLQAFLTATF